MKSLEKKIKKSVPFGQLAGYLRHLADAIENKTDQLPAELIDLPEPIDKLEIKSKSRNGRWELKIKIKAESSVELQPSNDTVDDGRQTTTAAAAKPEAGYKKLKKRMKNSFKAIGENLAVQNFPQPEVLNGFLADSEQMMSFTGAKYGEEYYPAYRKGCRRLAEAYESKNPDAFNAAYAALDQMKKDCHKIYK
jgi:XXXCH domain-containing protein